MKKSDYVVKEKWVVQGTGEVLLEKLAYNRKQEVIHFDSVGEAKRMMERAKEGSTDKAGQFKGFIKQHWSRHCEPDEMIEIQREVVPVTAEILEYEKQQNEKHTVKPGQRYSGTETKYGARDTLVHDATGRVLWTKYSTGSNGGSRTVILAFDSPEEREESYQLAIDAGHTVGFIREYLRPNKVPDGIGMDDAAHIEYEDILITPELRAEIREADPDAIFSDDPCAILPDEIPSLKEFMAMLREGM